MTKEKEISTARAKHEFFIYEAGQNSQKKKDLEIIEEFGKRIMTHDDSFKIYDYVMELKQKIKGKKT